MWQEAPHTAGSTPGGKNVPRWFLYRGMRDVRLAELAARQFNRVSRWQLAELGFSEMAIRHRLTSGRLVAVEQGVFAVGPVLGHDDWGRWKGATLTAPGTWLSHVSAAAARDLWAPARLLETVTRLGNGGPRRHGGLLVYRSTILDQRVTTTFNGVPMTTVPRTVLDLGRQVSHRALARLVRDAVRDHVTLYALGDELARHPRRRGARQLARTLSRYSGLPLERARSGAEIRAMEVLQDAGRPLPRLNVRIAGEEADLSWPAERLIVEIDGEPFHQDVGEDARKEALWEADGWTVRRLPSDEVHARPDRLLALTPT